MKVLKEKITLDSYVCMNTKEILIPNSLFLQNSWIIPRTVFLDGTEIKNSGFKIQVDLLDLSQVCDFYVCSGYYKSYIRLKVISNDPNSGTSLRVETKNLLMAIQYSGIESNGFLGGTYRLNIIHRSLNVYGLIPEDSIECKVKSEVSDIFYDKDYPFKSKGMIPGHLYISKSKLLFLYVGELKDIEIIDKIYIYGINPGINHKGIIYITDRRIYDILVKNIQNFKDLCIRSRDSSIIRCVSMNYSGKDLGEFYPGSDLKNCVSNSKDLELYPTYLFFIDNLWKTNESVRNELLNRIENNNSICFNFYPNSVRRSILYNTIKNGKV